MDLSKLISRVDYLKEEVKNSNLKVDELTKQLQQATLHMHTVYGHYNEASLLLEDEKKQATEESNHDDIDSEIA